MAALLNCWRGLPYGGHGVLFPVLVLLAGLSLPGAAQTNMEVRLPEGATVLRDVAYSKFPQTVMDVYSPAGEKTGKRPAVIVIHGGGWTGGAKAGMLPGFVLRYLAKGFVVANVEYRLASVAPAPAAVEDVLQAANFFVSRHKEYGFDKNKVAVTGDSAGGHLALMVGLTPRGAKFGKPARVQAVVNFYGIVDVDDQLHGPNERDYATRWVPAGPERTELARRVSPITYVRRDLPPVLTLHGDADPVVPYEHGVKITKALVDAGAKAEMISVREGKHGFPPSQLDELYVRIFEFLARQGVS